MPKRPVRVLVPDLKKPLLDQIMSNGKRLGDCTREDCFKLAAEHYRLAALMYEEAPYHVVTLPRKRSGSKRRKEIAA